MYEFERFVRVEAFRIFFGRLGTPNGFPNIKFQSAWGSGYGSLNN